MTVADSVRIVVLLIVAFLATVAATAAYRGVAIRRRILASPNFRSLHQHPVPSGAGIVFSVVCMSGVLALFLAGMVTADLTAALVGGGAIATLVGFVDDTNHIGARWKFAAQGLLAAGVLISFGSQPLVRLPQIPVLFDLALSWLGLVWLMNLYNFMDGVDGMAASGAVFFGVAATTVLVLAAPLSPPPTYAGIEITCILVAVCCLGFLILNRPPARVFMGDAGSLFLGFVFGALIAKTTGGGFVNLWTWFVIFGYFAGDTTTTTIVRIVMTSNWYGQHRSHAYQNLARLWDSHLKVVVLVSLYHVLWLLPLAVWSVLVPASGPVAALLGIGPVVLWSLRHGPLRSNS